MMRIHANAVAVLLAVLACPSAHARTVIVDSLEWMSADAPLIVEGTVMAAEDTVEAPHGTFRDITIRVINVVKGLHEAKALKVRLGRSNLHRAKRGLEWRDSGHKYLFFLRRGQEATDGKPLAEQWVLREWGQSVVDLEKPTEVYKANMTLAMTEEEILRIVRQYARWKPLVAIAKSQYVSHSQSGHVRLEIQGSAHIHTRVGSYINVPAEETYRGWAMSMARSDQVRDRERGADALRNYPGPETIVLLGKLLEDAGEAKWSSQALVDPLVRVAYPVRMAAYDALLTLGENPEKPLFERQPTPLEQRRAVEDRWTRSLSEVLPKGWLVHSIESASAPAGWERIAGGDGLHLLCRTPVPVDSPKIGVHQPHFSVYVMPRNWEGRNRTVPGEALKNQAYTPPSGTPDRDQPMMSARYMGQCSNRYGYFGSTVGHAGWADPHAVLVKYFGLKVHRTDSE
jgi:hypothetical protein